MSNLRIPTSPTALYISHGGGPLPILGDAEHAEMVTCLKRIADTIYKPSAIIVVSAHWEENVVSVTGNSKPEMIYDYYGFPEESYEITYPADGHPRLAEDVLEHFAGRQIEAKLDSQRGFDHGLYIPLMLMYPKADIPCIQISLQASLDPLEHIRIGEALSVLDQDGLLILGSGFSFHNMRAFGSPVTPESQSKNEAFEEWLIDTCSDRALSEAERAGRLAGWEQAPFARYCHPREEHLLPLHVCYGSAKSPCVEYLELSIMKKSASCFFW